MLSGRINVTVIVKPNNDLILSTLYGLIAFFSNKNKALIRYKAVL